MNTPFTRRLGRVRSRNIRVRACPAEYRGAESVEVEQAPASTPAPRGAVRPSAVLRAALLVGSLGAACVAWLIASGSSQPAEPELALLLRGMAALKGLLALAAAGLVWWRVGQPVAMRAAVTYIVCVSSLCAATVVIWQLAFIATAAVLFHVAGFVFLVLALREGRQVLRFGQQAPNPSIERPAKSTLRVLSSAAHVER